MKTSGRFLVIALVALFLPACTYVIQPAVPVVPTPKGVSKLSCKILMLVPQEFVNREYVSSFEGREFRYLVGHPAIEAIEILLRSRFEDFSRQDVVGDGTIEFLQLTSKEQATPSLVARPRFIRLESSVRPFRYNIELGLALDIAGLSQPVSVQGQGVGTAGLYIQSAIQGAADQALSEAITLIGESLPSACK